MPYFSDFFTKNINKIIEYQEYTKLNNYNKQDKSLPKLAVRYPNRFSDSLPQKKYGLPLMFTGLDVAVILENLQ